MATGNQTPSLSGATSSLNKRFLDLPPIPDGLQDGTGWVLAAYHADTDLTYKATQPQVASLLMLHANQVRGADKYARNRSELLRLAPAKLTLGTQATVFNDTDEASATAGVTAGLRLYTVVRAEATEAGSFVIPADTVTGEPASRGKWVPSDSQEAALPAVRLYTAQALPTGKYEEGETVKADVSGERIFVEPRRLLDTASVEFEDGIPAPTLPDGGPLWRIVSPAGRTYVGYQVLSGIEAARNLVNEEQVRENVAYYVPRFDVVTPPGGGPSTRTPAEWNVLLYGAQRNAFRPAATQIDNTTGALTEGTYDLTTDTFTPAGSGGGGGGGVTDHGALTGLGDDDHPQYYNASRLTTALDTNSTGDRARANHTGTQAATTITGLATVATSGSYNDLSAKPAAAIPLAGTAPSAPVTGNVVFANGVGVALYDGVNDTNIRLFAEDGVFLQFAPATGTDPAVLIQFGQTGIDLANEQALVLRSANSNALALTANNAGELLVNGVAVGSGGSDLTPDQLAGIQAAPGLSAANRVVLLNELGLTSYLRPGTSTGTGNLIVGPPGNGCDITGDNTNSGDCLISGGSFTTIAQSYNATATGSQDSSISNSNNSSLDSTNAGSISGGQANRILGGESNTLTDCEGVTLLNCSSLTLTGVIGPVTYIDNVAVGSGGGTGDEDPRKDLTTEQNRRTSNLRREAKSHLSNFVLAENAASIAGQIIQAGAATAPSRTGTPAAVATALNADIDALSDYSLYTIRLITTPTTPANPSAVLVTVLPA